MPIASRYLATVRRAMSTPASLQELDELSSERIAAGALGVDQLADLRLAPLRPRPRRRRRRPIAEVKKYFSSKRPRGMARYLFEVTRLTVDSCMPIASATVRRFSGRRCCDAVGEEAVLLADDLGGDLEDRALRAGRALFISQLAGPGSRDERPRLAACRAPAASSA